MSSPTSAALKTLVLDGSQVSVDPAKTFSVISQELKRGLGPQRVLTEIVIDGRAIDLAEEEAMASKPLAELGDVVFKTRDVVELFKESLQLAPRICEALLMDCDDVENFFKANDMRQAQERIGELTSLLEWLLQLISGMQSIGGRKLEEMHYGEVSVVESVNKMQYLLGKLHLQLAGKQWDSFRECLGGEFKVEVAVWKRLFEDASQNWQPAPSDRAS